VVVENGLFHFIAIRREYKIDHKDCICDMTFIEREQGLLVTGSRDSTVKIWK
jgi:hypothetical protein